MTGFLITDPFELAKQILDLQGRVKAIEDKLRMVAGVKTMGGPSPVVTVTAESVEALKRV